MNNDGFRKDGVMQLSFSVDEAAKSTGLGRTRLYDAINDGVLRAKKFGKRTIVLRDDLEEFLSRLESYPSKNTN